MWKKHKIDFLICGISAIGVIAFVLFLVIMCELLGIHVPGSREMWIGFVGAVIGGIFTLFGVLITIYKQEENDEEKKRLMYMPILDFKVLHNDDKNKEANATYTVVENEIATSWFAIYENKDFVTIQITVVNNLCAFDFTVEDIAVNGKLIPHGSAFNPAKERIVAGRGTSIAFDIEDDKNKNVFCVIRFSYKDIFGNKYFQDLPFTYFETTIIKENKRGSKQIIEVRDIKQPIFVTKEIALETVIKDYVDYKVFSE